MDAQEPTSASQETEGFTFDRLYHEGRVYVFPYLFEPTVNVLEETEEEMPSDPIQDSPEELAEPTPSSSSPNKRKMALMEDTRKRKASKPNEKEDEGEFSAMECLISQLEKLTIDTDLPSFVFHNDTIEKDKKKTGEKDIVIMSRKTGIIYSEVKSVGKRGRWARKVKKAVKQLLNAREDGREKLKGKVKPESETYAIALPNMSSDKEEAVRRCVNEELTERGIKDMSHVVLLLGRDPAVYEGLLKPLAERAASDVWEVGSSQDEDFDSTFKAAAQEYMSVDSMDSLHDAMQKLAGVHRRWLLTEEQMDVRDLPSKLLHIYGTRGSGKTLLLLHRARHWLREGKAVVITTSSKDFDLLKARMGRIVLRDQDPGADERLRICRDFKAIDSAVKELKSQQPNTEICLVTDELHNAEAFVKLVNAIESKTIQQCWSADVRDFPDMDDEAMTSQLAARARALGWRSEKLPECIRCPHHVVQLLKRLLTGSGQKESIQECHIPRPCTFESVGIAIVDHASHQQIVSGQPDTATQPDLQTMLQMVSRCEQCKRKLTEALKPDWKRWVALCTGNGVYKGLRDLATWLEDLGVPSVCELDHGILGNAEIPVTVLASRLRKPAITMGSFSAAGLEAWQRRVEDARHRAAVGLECMVGPQQDSGVEVQQDSGVGLQQDSGVEVQQDCGVGPQQDSGVGAQQERVVGARRMGAGWRVLARWWYRVWAALQRDHVVAEWRERVVVGVSESGQPAMHVVWHKYFRGLEKDSVLLIHWDQKDFPAREDQSDVTRERRSRHCREWIEAASRCQGQLVILLLSPSPARSYLRLSSR